MNAQIIEREGRPEYAVIPWSEWAAITERLEELQDIVDADRAKADIEAGEETYPADLIDRLMGDEHPVKVWRDYRGMSGKALAEAVDVTPAAISQIENGKRDMSVELLQKLAAVLRVDMDDLVG